MNARSTEFRHQHRFVGAAQGSGLFVEALQHLLELLHFAVVPAVIIVDADDIKEAHHNVLQRMHGGIRYQTALVQLPDEPGQGLA
ncbi:hypothetical protein D3C80_1892350 [compost metagenome]